MPSPGLSSRRRLMTGAIIGIVCGAFFGALLVLVGWFPSAMATFAEHPQYVDPRATVVGWCATWATVCAAVGGIVGAGIGAASHPQGHA